VILRTTHRGAVIALDSDALPQGGAVVTDGEAAHLATVANDGRAMVVRSWLRAWRDGR
jgi:hypothetical protein